jgi:Zn-finger nucleic acid-binding protein
MTGVARTSSPAARRCLLSHPAEPTIGRMEGGYRSARTCPACAAMLTELSTVSAVVDRCPDCGGLWIEWFDGELSMVAAGARHAPPATRAESTGAGACPDCRAPLSAVRYPEEKSGVEILRCGACAGAFVPRGALEVIAALGPPSDTPPEEPSWLETMAQRIRAVVRG